jgi:hypothetical protein
MENFGLLLLHSCCHPSSGPVRRKKFNDGLMATLTVLPHHRQGWSLSELSTELLILVLEAVFTPAAPFDVMNTSLIAS